EATAAAIDTDGWLHTGDIGTMDAGGHLAITDRIKDIIVLANGKNVAPQPIESLLKQSPLIAEAVLFGDGQNSLVALIVPRFDELRRRLGRAGTADTAELTGSADAVRLVRAEINALSADLADYERIKQFRLLPREFSVDSDELTPTMKVKRRIVAERYADELAAMLR
ncbi:MAG: long-chain fatty acid--CoA ligase, partial [Chthonomonadales bacterium]|nr:long-chain fatty acid--CoA ligase [Chthonomonadales bacterium]